MLGALTQEEIVELLRQSSIGRIGCTDGHRPYIVPVSYVYMDGFVLCHSRDGMKVQMMRNNPSVCFEVDEIRAYDRWSSVIAWGQYEELMEDEDIAEARKLFPEELLEMKTMPATPSPETRGDRIHQPETAYLPSVFYRIVFTEWSGRYEAPVR